eukprot:2045721-Pyramimonas_sp.AAC.1
MHHSTLVNQHSAFRGRAASVPFRLAGIFTTDQSDAESVGIEASYGTTKLFVHWERHGCVCSDACAHAVRRAEGRPMVCRRGYCFPLLASTSVRFVCLRVLFIRSVRLTSCV